MPCLVEMAARRKDGLVDLRGEMTDETDSDATLVGLADADDDERTDMTDRQVVDELETAASTNRDPTNEWDPTNVEAEPPVKAPPARLSSQRSKPPPPPKTKAATKATSVPKLPAAPKTPSVPPRPASPAMMSPAVTAIGLAPPPIAATTQPMVAAAAPPMTRAPSTEPMAPPIHASPIHASPLPPPPPPPPELEAVLASVVANLSDRPPAPVVAAERTGPMPAQPANPPLPPERGVSEVGLEVPGLGRSGFVAFLLSVVFFVGNMVKAMGRGFVLAAYAFGEVAGQLAEILRREWRAASDRARGRR
jgi:hypothetical protein